MKPARWQVAMVLLMMGLTPLAQGAERAIDKSVEVAATLDQAWAASQPAGPCSARS